jgi:hypothetical protein
VWSTADCGWCPSGSGSGAPPNASGAVWYPSGVDVTLQAGDHWFFTPGDALNPLSTLISMYHNSVGANGHLELDFGIDRTGGVAPNHAVAYAQFGNWIRSCYGSPVASGALVPGDTTVTVTFASTSIVSDSRTDPLRLDAGAHAMHGPSLPPPLHTRLGHSGAWPHTRTHNTHTRARTHARTAAAAAAAYVARTDPYRAFCHTLMTSQYRTDRPAPNHAFCHTAYVARTDPYCAF